MQLERMTSPDVGSLPRNEVVCLLPLGSVEQHGPHLPLGTDSLLAHGLCLEVARRLSPAVLVVPPPWYGFSPHHMRFAGSVTLRSETFIALASDVVDSLVRHGFQRIVLVNGHGGNASLTSLIATELGHRHEARARIAGLTYFHLAAPAIDALRLSRTGGTGHACEVETALMQHLHPDLVLDARRQAHYPDTGTPYLSTDLTRGSRVASYTDFADLSPTGVLGDPTLATAEHGARLFEACATALADFVEDFLTWPERSPART
jgi:creatinine amidohydrolase